MGLKAGFHYRIIVNRHTQTVKMSIISAICEDNPLMKPVLLKEATSLCILKSSA